MQIDEVTPPEDALISPFVVAEAHYTDAFVTQAPEGATFAAYVEAFYTTLIFKAERCILSLAGMKSSDAEAAALAAGTADRFAAWQVEARRDSELLMAQKDGPTKSWLALQDGKLWFGSVVVPVERRGRLTLGPVFHSLMPAHKIYSRVLLSSARVKVARARTS